MNQDMQNIQKLLVEMYKGEWEANIVDGFLPEGSHVGYQSGYEFRIGEHVAKLDYGIRGMNAKHNARVVGDKIFLSYVN